MEGKTSAVVIGEFGITLQIDQKDKDSVKEYVLHN